MKHVCRVPKGSNPCFAVHYVTTIRPESLPSVRRYLPVCTVDDSYRRRVITSARENESLREQRKVLSAQRKFEDKDAPYEKTICSSRRSVAFLAILQPVCIATRPDGDAEGDRLFLFVDSVPATKETISRSHDLARGNARGSKTSASTLQGDCLHPSAYILLQHCGLGREQGKGYFRIAQWRPPNRLRIQSGKTEIGRDG
jgi:hypothetical protein